MTLRCPKHDIVFNASSNEPATVNGHPECPMCVKEKEVKNGNSTDAGHSE
jgi:hypothetical protein